MKQPRFILCKNKVLQQYNTIKQYADLISYSSKTNQDVTKILEKDTDSMFSVHFGNELKHIKDCSRVIFLAQGWTQAQIGHLIDKGITWFAVDNESDLETLLNYLKSSKEKVNLLLRLKLKENTIRTERYFVFGMKSAVINKRVKQLKDNKNIAKLGIHFHRKTQNMAEWSYEYELKHILDKETLEAIDYLNIGGGFPSEYANTNIDVIDSIFKKIKTLKQWLNGQNIKLILEPGRFIAAPAARLETAIIAIHDNNIIINASVYNSDMDAIIVPVKLLVEGELKKGEAPPYVIKGITPCSLDLFRYRCYLKDPKVGQKLTFLNAGAYNFTSDFCDLEKLPTVIIE